MNSNGLMMTHGSRAKDCSHPSFLEHDDVLFAAGVAETNRLLMTFFLGLTDCVFEEMRLMTTVTFIRGREDLSGHSILRG